MEINMNNNLKNEQEVVQPQNQIIFQNSEEIEKENDELFLYIEEYLSKQLEKIKKNNKLKNIVLEEILEQILAERKNYSKANKKINVLELENKMLKKIKARIEGLYKIYLIDEEKDVVLNKKFSVEEVKENDEDFRRLVEKYELKLKKELYGEERYYIKKLYGDLRDLISFYESNQKENIEEKMLNKIETPTSSNEIFKFNSLMSEEKIYNLKNENEELFQKIKDILDYQDNKIGNGSKLVKILEKLKFEREVYKNNKDGSFIVLENYKLQELLREINEICENFNEAFYEIAKKYEEDANLNEDAYKKIRGIYNKLEDLIEFYETTSKNLELIKLKNENEKYYAKIFNFLFEQCKNMEEKASLMEILEEINLFKEIWSKKNISKNYNILLKENENLNDVNKSLNNLLEKINGDNKFCEIINKYEEDKHFNYLLNYKEIRKLYRKLINLKDFYAFNSEETLENLNTITFNKEEKTNKTNVDEKERKMQSVKVFKQRYTKEAIYEEIPKIIAEIEKKLGDVQQNAENIKYIVSINFLKSMLEKLKTYYDEINYVKTIKERNKFDLLFFDLFQKFEEILFELKDKPETIKQFAVALDENNNEDVGNNNEDFEEEEVDRYTGDYEWGFLGYENDGSSEDEDRIEKDRENLENYYNKIKQILPEELGLFEELELLCDNIHYAKDPVYDCKKEKENLDKKLKKISDNMLKLNMRLNKFKSKLDLAIS